MEIPVYSVEKKKVGSVAWPEGQFSEKARESLIHQVVVQQRTNKRQGNAHVKNRSAVSGSWVYAALSAIWGPAGLIPSAKGHR